MDILRSPDFIAGCVAGSLGIVATQPLDVIRIRMQIPEYQKYGNITRQLSRILKIEGMRGMFRGVASPTLTVGLMSALLFQSYESSRAYLQKYRPPPKDGSLDTLTLALAGTWAGVVSCLITSPTEMIKVICQLENSPESATIRGELRVARQHGMFGLMRGFHITVLRDAPAFAIYFPLYAIVIHHFDPYHQTTWIPFMGGGLAGLWSWYAVYPIDVMKTQYQARQNHYRDGFLYGVRMQYKERGFKSFYHGVGATMLRAFPQHALVFISFEWVKQRLIDMKKTERKLDMSG